MQLSTGSGAGWCDLPEARLIGEWVDGNLGPSNDVAWGPTAAGRVAEVRIEFANGDPIIVRPKPTPWTEFDFWFAEYARGRSPTALIALDGQGKQLAREDLTGRSTTTPSPPAVRQS